MKATRPSWWLIFSCLLLWPSLGAAQEPASKPAPPAGAPAPPPGSADAKALAYYHFTLGHLYEEQAGDFARSDYLKRAIDEYKEALKYDPTSSELIVQLAEAYRRSGRIRDAVVETRQLLQDDPDNLAAHRLLGRIYFQTLGEPDAGGTPPKQTLTLAIEEYEQITRLVPNDADALFDLARLYRLNGELPKAEATLVKLLAVEPQSEVALSALASIYSDKGESKKAIELLQSAAAQASSSRLLAALAFAYEQAENYDNAIDAYRRALAQDSDNLDLRRRLAEVLLRSEHVEEALIEFKALAEADPSDALTMMRLSQIYRHQRKYDEAQQWIDKAKKADPDNLEVGYNEALLDEAQGRFDAAIAVLSDMVARMTRASGQYSQEEKHSRAVVLERLGMLYRDNEKFAEAIQVFELMLPLDEDSAHSGYAQIAETQRQDRQYDAARATLQQALERFPDDRDFTLQVAMLEGEQGQWQAAAERARSLLKNTPEDRGVYLALMQIYERNKQWTEAEEALAQTEKLSTGNDQLEQIHFLHGALYERQKKYQPAEQEFRQVLAINPESAITLNYLGYMFADQNMKLSESVEMLKKAVELDPYNGAYLDSLGWAYFRLGQFDQAEQLLLRAIERLSRDPTIHDHLGEVYFKTGRLALAAKAWERALEEWQHSAPADFEADTVAKLEEKLHTLKIRLAQETQKGSPKKPE